MNGQSDKEEAAGTVYNASLPFLNGDERERVKGQLFYATLYQLIFNLRNLNYLKGKVK